jgi:phosphoadenosine phosphosulfate reductase
MNAEALQKTLAEIAAGFSPATLACSLQAEDMVIVDAIARTGLPIEVFVLDTGRLHGDSLVLIERIKATYGTEPRVYAPDPAAVSDYVQAHGRDGFYASVELRERCCEMRKVEPLARALAGKRAWITGQRREQAASRRGLDEREFDALHGLEKFNPLAAWSEAEVWHYVRAHRVPYNRLYDQGYRSIGCAPCTRPVQPGEDARAGRWWWERDEHKECGIHVAQPGRAKTQFPRIKVIG